MGKSIRSKIKKRLRTAKRQRVDAMVLTPKLHEHNESLTRVIQGRSITTKRPKNAFKYPEAQGAIFPQHEIMKPIDYRAANLPMAQFAYRGNRRKYAGEELEHMKNLARTSHPKSEVLAGGGAILAKTGQRVSIKEAEALADPEGAALAEATPANSASAVAAAVAEDRAEADEDMDDSDESAEAKPEPVNAVDHTRRPVKKAANPRQGQRAATKSSRAGSSKSQGAPAAGKGKKKKKA
eukprot:TRINITY_DN55821_c0_g1_i1.p1 TRINITY_DN55821_c0_g1~~TRINITY_DN55821_c0_g1_i1.p1  ORF type:complete len:264 (+),score=66.15 TRINITY_DN55821_c0_g1_i1:80-793(+)